MYIVLVLFKGGLLCLAEKRVIRRRACVRLSVSISSTATGPTLLRVVVDLSVRSSGRFCPEINPESRDLLQTSYSDRKH